MLRNTILVGDVREMLRTLPNESVHCVVTSPPYWGLRDYGVEGMLGLEPTPEEYVANMVAVFRDVRRVLRRDGTLWLNLGDSYAGSWGNYGGQNRGNGTQREITNGSRAHQPSYDGLESWRPPTSSPPGLKPKDLVGIPWRVAFALQADGWWLRSDIIWSKPNPMPESVTDRPTKAHEYLFLLTKSERYYYDVEAIREPAEWARWGQQTIGKDYRGIAAVDMDTLEERRSAGRNKRTVWEIATEPYSEAHFATYPQALVLPCIQAGTSEHGCCSVCGAPWRRVVEIDDPEGRLGKGYHDHVDDLGRGQRGVFPAEGAPTKRTTGWVPTCKHEAPLAPCVVLDPFFGSGTTGLVALRAARDYIGIELNPAYAQMAERRLAPLQNQLRLL